MKVRNYIVAVSSLLMRYPLVEGVVALGSPVPGEEAMTGTTDNTDVEVFSMAKMQ